MSMLLAGIMGSDEVLRIRQPEGEWYRGDWVYNEEPDQEEVRCSVQELSRITVGKRGSSKLLKELEGDRTVAMIKILAPRNTFKEADELLGTPADIIVWEGRSYEVAVANHWKSAQALSHDEVYAKRIDHDIDRHSFRG